MKIVREYAVFQNLLIPSWNEGEEEMNWNFLWVYIANSRSIIQIRDHGLEMGNLKWSTHFG